jgi:hypothetical protein
LLANASPGGVRIIFLTAIVTSKQTGDKRVVNTVRKIIGKPLNTPVLVACLKENTKG